MKRNDKIESNKKRKYTLIPEGFEKEYEEYLRQEAHKEFEESRSEVDKKKKSIKSMLEGIEEITSKDKRTKFIEDMSVEEIDHKEIYSKMRENQNKLIIDYAKSIGIDEGKIKGIYEKNNEFTITYEEDGKVYTKTITLDNLKGENEK